MDTTWTSEGIKEFIRGTWRFHSFQIAGRDTLSPASLLGEQQLRFTDSILEVFAPLDSLVGRAEFTIDSIGPGLNNTFVFFINHVMDIDERLVVIYASGRLIPCNSELIFNHSFLDGPDRFYRKVE